MKSLEKKEFSNPGFVMAAIFVFVGDLSFLLVFGIVLPAVGLVFLAAYLAAHYICAIIAATMFFKKLHTIPKFVFIGFAVNPLPMLSVGLLVANILQNKFVEKVAIQAAILAAGAATGGAGAVAGEAALATAETGAKVAAEEGAKVVAKKAAKKAAKKIGEKALEAAESKIDEYDAGIDLRREAVSEKDFGMPEEAMEEAERAMFEPAAENKKLFPEPETEQQLTEKGKSPDEEGIDKERLGGAYAEEEAVRRTMEEVEVEGNVVNLKPSGNGRSASGDNISSEENSPENERLAA